MIPQQWLTEAAERIKTHLRLTPLSYDPDFDIYLKWENRQKTGSFKARGAFNKVLSLEKWEQEAGLLAASAGNHGQQGCAGLFDRWARNSHSGYGSFVEYV